MTSLPETAAFVERRVQTRGESAGTVVNVVSIVTVVTFEAIG
jgi:hypothetical protein